MSRRGVASAKRIHKLLIAIGFNRLRLHEVSIMLILVTASCFPDDKDTIGPRILPKTTPFTCERGDLFIRIGSSSADQPFFVGDAISGFFSVSQNRLNLYNVVNLERINYPIFPLQEVAASYYAYSTSRSGWLITRNMNPSTWTALLLDTLGNGLIKTTIEPDANENNLVVVTGTPDQGFVLVVNAATNGDTDKYSVYRYLPTGVLLWKKVLTNKGRISSVIALRDGGFLLGGSNFPGVENNTNSYLVKLDDEGNQLWSEVKHLASLGNSFSIDYLMEDTAGNYYMLLVSRQRSLSLIKSNNAYQILWTRPVDSQFSFSQPRMLLVNDEVLVYYGAAMAQSARPIFSSPNSVVTVTRDGAKLLRAPVMKLPGCYVTSNRVAITW